MSDETASGELVRPPGSTATGPSPAEVAEDVRRWLSEANLAALVEAFDGPSPEGDAFEQLTYLDAFSAEHWNPRANSAERDQIGNYPLTPEQSALTMETARALGLTHSTEPTGSAYDHVLVLGGLARACLLRPRYAADLIGQGLHAGSVAALTAFRELSSLEQDLLHDPQVGLSASNELEVMAEGMRRAFDLAECPTSSEVKDDTNPFLSSRRDRWETPGPPVEVLVAPTGDPTRRANSADTYEYWAALTKPSVGERVLLITSAIYVPYQGAFAVSVLGLGEGLHVETIGLDAGAPEFGVLRQRFTAAHYLQEIRSAVLGAKALYRAASAAEST
jgi:hypothetical protein